MCAVQADPAVAGAGAGGLSTYYPSNYWHADEGGKITALEEFYRRTVLQDHVGFLQKAIDHARPAPGKPALVMDVGCGGGLLLRLLHEKGHAVMGMDFSLDAASIAWKQNGVPAMCASLPQAPLPDESISCFRCFMCWSISTSHMRIWRRRTACWRRRGGW